MIQPKKSLLCEFCSHVQGTIGYTVGHQRPSFEKCSNCCSHFLNIYQAKLYLTKTLAGRHHNRNQTPPQLSDSTQRARMDLNKKSGYKPKTIAA